MNDSPLNLAVLGTGRVGEAIANKLISLGHHVCWASRSPANPKSAAWVAQHGARASHATYADAAAAAEVVFFCTPGEATVNLANEIGATRLAGKIIVDISNPLDFSRGLPPSLLVCNTDSVGEQLQRALPDSRVVKTLNTVNSEIMVHPAMLAEPPTMFLSGNDPAAKERVAQLLRSFGWVSLLDLGDIPTARGTEMLLPLWLSASRSLGTLRFGFRLVR